MRKTKAAVRYGMETLKLSPDELFKLIESSQGYEGEDYPRWLAGKIIEVAEEDGVQYSQLLVKKFNIVNELLEEVEGSQVVKEDFLDIFKSCLHEDLYSVDFEGLGKGLDVDWYNGIDFDSENSFFVKEKLPEDLQEKIFNDEKFSVLFKLASDNANKKSDLYSDAKSQGIFLHSKGAVILYRLCNLVASFDLTNAKFGIMVPVKFLYDPDNYSIIDYMLSFFNVEVGYSMKSIEVSLNAFNSGDLAFLALTPRRDDEGQDGITLTAITLDDSELAGFVELNDKRYSKSFTPMLNKITDNSPNLDTLVPYVSANGEVGECNGYSEALGYLNINGNISLTTLPAMSGKKSIPITEANIKDIIAYYGVTVSRELDWGYSSDIPCLIDGRVGYEELLYNCLPLFLFDYKSKFCRYDELVLPDGDVVSVDNKLDVITSDVVKGLLDVGHPYFSFEAKELYNICVDYINYTKDNIGISGKTFEELRGMSDNANFNRLYEEKLAILKEYVNNLSKKFL